VNVTQGRSDVKRKVEMSMERVVRSMYTGN